MDLRKIKKLIELLEQSELVEMEITEGDNTIRLSRAGSVQVSAAPPVVAHAAPVASPAGAEAATPAAPQAGGDGEVIESPMVGTFYASSSPEAEPFVAVGARIRPGDTLCIIEAMKTFNSLQAEREGVIKAVYKQTGDPVEYGEPLFLVD